MSDIAIRLDNVSKYYKLYDSPKDRLREALHPLGKKYHKEFYALDSIDLEISQGEAVGVVGKNGSGKTTLLKLISGVLTPNDGHINVRGKVSALLELGAGFNPEFTGTQNIRFYATIVGLSNEETEQQFDDIIAFADIGQYIHQPLKTYSNGMRARLAFAIAVHLNPDILILDEVMAVGDAQFRRKCYARMEEFFAAGKSIIYVSHDTDTVNQLCNKAIFINDGRLILAGQPKVVTSGYLKYMYAKPADKEKVMAELAKDNTAEAVTTRGAKNNIAKSSCASHEVKRQQPLLLPELRSKNMVEYGYKPITIYDARITTLAGKKVNALVYGDEYEYIVHYKSLLSYSVKKVAFGLDFKNEKGMKVSSIESVLSKDNKLFIEELKPDKEVTAVFRFRCQLIPGIYYTNSGLSSFASGEQEVLNRIIDIYCFKVLEPDNRIFSGVSNLFVSATLKADIAISHSV